MAKGKSSAKGGIAALEQSPSHLLHRALQRALDIYVEEFGEGGITQRQFAVLAAADEREGATQADLVRITGIDRSTLADMARRMIGKGLLERERSNVDARANAVRLTEAGKLALAEARPKMTSADARLMKLISGGGRRATFLNLLHDLTRSADAPAVKAAKPKVEKEKPTKPPKAGKAHKGKKAKKKAA
jgi:MarR family transcriptional regulator, temperature-dependent positive regulator of motility